MSQSMPEKNEVELNLERAAERAAEDAEADVMNGADKLCSAVENLSRAIPNSGPLQAMNSIGKIAVGVESTAAQANEIWSQAIRTATPIIRLSKKAVKRVRDNPSAFILLSLAGLAGALFLMRRPTSIRRSVVARTRLK